MASVFLGDLDDVIGPSQACVNPIFATDTSTPPSQRSAAPENEDKGRAQVTVEAAWMDVEEAGGAVKPDLIKATGPGSAASVSLNDCLACSGCVTSAETVLISQQSTDQFLRILRGGRGGQTQALVVALSPQSLASLGVAFGWAAPRLPRRLGSFFKALARRLVAPPNEPLPVHVYSTASAAPVALAEATAEFVARYRHCQPPPPGIALHPPPPSPSPPAWEAPPTSRALSATEDAAHPDLPLGVPAPPPRHQTLPMLVSECPGWVCYAEKTTPQVLPLLSTAKSPQQCLGTLVKAVLAPASGLRPGQVCVVAVMPCYDKKLEASRRDFLHAEWGEVPEVDMVLTAGEVGELVREYGPGEEEGCSAWGGGEGGGEEGPANGPNEGGNVMDLEGAEATLGRNGGLVPSTGGRGWEVGSGGYAEHVFRGAAWELFGVRVGPGPLTYREGRNADYKEAVLEVEGQEVLRVALAYGFRNIQGVVNKLRRGRGGLHLVEVMACPSGCVNGGGMLRGPASEGTARARERIKNVRESLLQAQEAEAEGGGEGGGEGVAAWVYREVAREGPLGPAALRLFHTRFHAVPKLEAVNPSVIKW